MKQVLIIGLMALAWWSPAQYRFSHLTSNDGLSQNSVTDLFQDSRGFVWIATQDGLNWYDGHEFVQYNTAGILPLPDNFVWDITEDQHGNIWVASRKGALRINWRSNKVTNFQIARDDTQSGAINQVVAITRFHDRLLISYYQKTFEIDPAVYADSSHVILSSPTLKHPSAINDDLQLHHAFRANNKEYKLFQGHLQLDETEIPFPGDHLLTFENSGFLILDGGFLVSTRVGVLRFDFESSTFHEVPCVQTYVTDILVVGNQIWVGTSDGIALLDRNTFDCKGWIKPGEGDEDLAVGAITSLLQTKEGLVWVGTSNGGIHIYDPRKEQFKFLKKEHGIGRPPVWAILQEGSYAWIGTEDGLCRLTLTGPITNSLFSKDAIASVDKIKLPIPPNTRITAIEQIDSRTILVGTSKGHLLAIDMNSLANRVIGLSDATFPGVNNTISTIRKSKNFVWVTSHYGLYQFNHTLGFIKKIPFDQFAAVGLVNEYFLSAYVDRNDRLWLGSNIGVFCLDAIGKIEYYPYKEANPSSSPAFNFISGFHEDTQGRIWIATYGGGVSVLDIAAKKFFHLTRANGLANEVCSSITGMDTRVWITTNAGISQIDTETFAIRNFSKADGLINNEFAITAVTKTNAGELIFGNVDGLVAFSPVAIAEKDTPPAPTFTKILVNYLEVPANRFQNGLTLFPDDRSVVIQFSSLDYRFKSDFQYEYRLDGFDQKWVRASSPNRQATYTPSSGEYRFRVRAIHNSLAGPEAILNIRVVPPFYLTHWFIGMCILLLLGSTIFIVRYYSHRKLRARLRELETQQKIQKERERISRDLHDNVGSQIAYIATSLDQLSDRAKATELSEVARETMNQLRESIWAINHDKVDLSELKSKVIGFLVQVMQNEKNTRHLVEIEESSETLNPNTAINIFRIIQEAVNNALKHANASEIRISITITDSPTLTISDDGCGFDGQDKEGHYGLANLRNRVAEIGGTFVLETEPDKGTRITISGFEIGQMT